MIATTSKAQKLYNEVIQAYKDNPNLTMREILDTHLKKFDDDIAKELNAVVIGMMGDMGDKFITSVLPYTKAELSTALYQNAKGTAKVTYKVIQEHIKSQSTIVELREALYDGYGYEELLPIKKTLPRYLSKILAEEKVAKLTTKPLKNAYIAYLEAKTDKQMEKAMKVALEERARYYATRIAKTEEAKAFTLSNATRHIEKDIKFVKWTLSSLHRTTCICEFYANQDIGYGRGIYRLLDAPAPVYSTHPNCLCSLRPVYREPQYKVVAPTAYVGSHTPAEIKIRDLFK